MQRKSQQLFFSFSSFPVGEMRKKKKIARKMRQQVVKDQTDNSAQKIKINNFQFFLLISLLRNR